MTRWGNKPEFETETITGYEGTDRAKLPAATTAAL